MGILDYVIVVVYILGMLGMGLYFEKKNKNSEDYFAGGRSMPWYALGMSVGLTMISANSFVGGPGWGYFDGIAAAMMNISVPIAILFATYTILPIVHHAKVLTVYEYVNLRLGTKTRILNVIAWLLQNLVFIGGFVYTPSLVLEAITGIGTNVWVPIIVAITIILTVTGGIKAVIWSDFVQGIILFLGLVISIVVAVNMLPMSFGEVVQSAREVGLMQSFDFTFEASTMNFWCAMIGGAGMWFGYFGFDQGQIQRYVSAKDMTTIKKTGILSSLSMQVIYWLCFFLGVVLYVFYKTYPATLDFVSDANLVMIDYLINYVPSGIVGLIIAAVFAAAISSIDSVLNSITAVFVKDIYEPYISKSKEETPLKKSMIFTGIFGILVVIFVYLYLGDSAAAVMELVGMYTSPAGSILTGIMIICCFMPSANDNSCFWGSMLSILVSLGLTYVPAWQELGLHWLWTYVYGSAMCILFTWILSKSVFRNAEKEKETYQYTVYGTIEALKGQKDAEGHSIEPLAFDKYAVWVLVVFFAQCLVLWMLQ